MQKKQNNQKIAKLQFYQGQIGSDLNSKSDYHEFIPIDKNHIKFYCCGPTVYDNIHVGNARPLVVFDVLYRLLLSVFPKVTFVRNITDIDDKIITRAFENKESFESLTSRTEKAFLAATTDLKCLEPTFQPKASEYISEIIDLILDLIDKGYAYESAGDVYFEVAKWSSYGKFAKKTLSDLKAGARIEVSDLKKSPLDFALWKSCKNDNEPSWSSPFGKGRPGWHIECSAMSHKLLGSHFDIHAGGIDLIFPHHQNEVAQSCSASGERSLANYWLHNGYVTLDDKKMSKSENLMVNVCDVLEKYDGEVLRLLLLQTHYRSPLNFNDQALMQAQNFLDNLYSSLAELNTKATDSVADNIDEKKPSSEFLELIANDLNTPKALAHQSLKLKELIANKEPSKQTLLLSEFISNYQILGLVNHKPREWFSNKRAKLGLAEISDDKIKELMSKRGSLRADGKYKEADAIRDELKSLGIILEDDSSGTKFKRVG